MKRLFGLMLVLALVLSGVLITSAVTLTDSSDVAALMPDGSVYEHTYDTEGNHIGESATLADGSYHEFQYDKDGNVVNEIHK